MKKLLLIVIFCIFLLTGCSKEYATRQPELNHTFITIEKYSMPGYNIVYHKDTKVMYVVSNCQYNRGNFTLLVNPDGSPMLWEEE